MSPSRSRSEQVVGNSHDTDAKGGAQVKSSAYHEFNRTRRFAASLSCASLAASESMRLVPVGSTPGGLRRCNLPGAFDLIGAPCDCPCSTSGAGRAGLAQQRFRDFLLEIGDHPPPLDREGQ